VRPRPSAAKNRVEKKWQWASFNMGLLQND
jgi:hypothetical protein